MQMMPRSGNMTAQPGYKLAVTILITAGFQELMNEFVQLPAITVN